MNFRKAILVLIVMIFGVMSVHAQCGNKISISSEVNELSNTGTISVEIKSVENYICVLVIVKSNGDTLISEKRGNGNKNIQFANLEVGLLYSASVKFSNEKEFICSKMSKSILLK